MLQSMRIIILSSCLNPAIPARFGNPPLNQLKISFTQDTCCEKAWPFEGGYMLFLATGTGHPAVRAFASRTDLFLKPSSKRSPSSINLPIRIDFIETRQVTFLKTPQFCVLSRPLAFSM
jgi:hypothetical protein